MVVWLVCKPSTSVGVESSSLPLVRCVPRRTLGSVALFLQLGVLEAEAGGTHSPV